MIGSISSSTSQSSQLTRTQKDTISSILSQYDGSLLSQDEYIKEQTSNLIKNALNQTLNNLENYNNHVSFYA